MNFSALREGFNLFENYQDRDYSRTGAEANTCTIVLTQKKQSISAIARIEAAKQTGAGSPGGRMPGGYTPPLHVDWEKYYRDLEKRKRRKPKTPEKQPELVQLKVEPARAGEFFHKIRAKEYTFVPLDVEKKVLSEFSMRTVRVYDKQRKGRFECLAEVDNTPLRRKEEEELLLLLLNAA